MQNAPGNCTGMDSGPKLVFGERCGSGFWVHEERKTMITIDLVDERVEHHAKPTTWNHPGRIEDSSHHLDPLMTLAKSHQNELLITAQNIRLASVASGGASTPVIDGLKKIKHSARRVLTLAERYSNRNRIRP